MACRTLIAIALLLALAAPQTGCGGATSTSSAGEGRQSVVLVTPQPFFGAVSLPFTLSGQNFASLQTPPGSLVTLRFDATAGTPFQGGTSASVEVPGTVTGPTTITGMSPLAVIVGSVTATITVVLPSGQETTSPTPIATFLGIAVTSVTPSSAPSEIPTALTVNGDGFGPNGAAATVRFFVDMGTPFLGGTASFLDVPGTVTSINTVDVPTSPVAGVTADTPIRVHVTLPGPASGASAGTIFTFTAPVVSSFAPLVVDEATPTAFTITGSGFGPVGGAVAVRFRAVAGTPFAGGTAASLTVGGTVASPTSITGTTPIAGLANKQMPHVDVTFGSGGSGTGASPQFTFEVAPDAVDDPLYTTVGNVQLVVPAATGVLVNDSDPDGDAITVTAFDAASVNGGVVSVAADGSFTYNPPAGFEGADTFTYTISDSFLTDTATVTVTVDDVVWFIDENATVAGDGRITSPFDTLAAFLAGAADEVDDFIFLYSSATTYAGQLTLLGGQQLIGQGVALVVGGTPIVGASTKPTLGAAGGTAVTLASGNTVRGLDVTNSAGRGILGTSVGTLNADTVGVNATGGAAVEITTGTLAVTFDSLTSLNAPSDGIDIVDCTGTFAVTGAATVTGAGNDALNIQGNLAGASTAAFTFGSITIDGAAQDGICLANHDGAFTVTGATTITDPAGGPSTDYGIDMLDCAPTSAFSFGAVDIDDVVDSGIRMSNTGANGVTFGAVTIDGVGQHGIEISGGSAAFTFTSLSVGLCGDDGISVSNAGGSFEVTGITTLTTPGNDMTTPGADHGIDISSSSATFTFEDLDITDSAGHGILLTSNGGSFTCRDGLIDEPDAEGLHATTCTGAITLGAMMTGVTFQNTGAALVDGQESNGISFDDCTGDITIEGCTFKDMRETAIGAGQAFDNNGIHMDNRDGGTLGSLQIIDCDFQGTEAAGLGTTTDHGIFVRLELGSTITDMDVTGCTCAGVGRAFCEVLVDADDTGDACLITDLNISSNGLTTPIESQAEAIHVRVNGASSVPAFSIDNNSILGTTLSKGNGIRFNLGQFGAGTNSSATAEGTIDGNTVDGVGDGSTDNGIELQVQEGTDLVASVNNNTVDGCGDVGIKVRVFDDGTADLTIDNNLVGQTTLNAGEGIVVRTQSAIALLTLCVDISNNTCAAGDDLVCDLAAGVFRLLGITGMAPFSAAQVDTYLTGPQGNSATAASLGSGFTACSTIRTPAP